MPTKYRRDQLKNTKEIDPERVRKFVFWSKPETNKTSDTTPCHSLHPTLLTLNSALFTRSLHQDIF